MGKLIARLEVPGSRQQVIEKKNGEKSKNEKMEEERSTKRASGDPMQIQDVVFGIFFFLLICFHIYFGFHFFLCYIEEKKKNTVYKRRLKTHHLDLQNLSQDL